MSEGLLCVKAEQGLFVVVSSHGDGGVAHHFQHRSREVRGRVLGLGLVGHELRTLDYRPRQYSPFRPDLGGAGHVHFVHTEPRVRVPIPCSVPVRDSVLLLNMSLDVCAENKDKRHLQPRPVEKGGSLPRVGHCSRSSHSRFPPTSGPHIGPSGPITLVSSRRGAKKQERHRWCVSAHNMYRGARPVGDLSTIWLLEVRRR